MKISLNVVCTLRGATTILLSYLFRLVADPQVYLLFPFIDRFAQSGQVFVNFWIDFL